MGSGGGRRDRKKALRINHLGPGGGRGGVPRGPGAIRAPYGKALKINDLGASRPFFWPKKPVFCPSRAKKLDRGLRKLDRGS